MQDAGGQHSYCPAYLRAPACRHGLLARQRAIFSRKEQQAFLALRVVTPSHPIQPLSFPRSLLPPVRWTNDSQEA